MLRTLLLATAVAVGVIYFVPQFPYAISGIIGDAFGAVRFLGPSSGNRTLDAMIAHEERKLRMIRQEFGAFRALEICRRDVAQFERFAQDYNLDYTPRACRR